MYEFVINRNYKKVRFGQDQIGEFVSVIDGDGFDNIPYQGTITEVEAEEMINSGEFVSVETNLPTIEGIWYGNQSIH